MSTPLLTTIGESKHLAITLAPLLGAEEAAIELRRFPDGETYLRYLTSPEGRDIIILAPLDRPNEKVMPVLFAAQTARNLGAESVGLVCPYLPYMRQDRRFNPGEAVTSDQFAALLSGAFDWLVTTDPHLHRHTSLAEIYSIPTVAAHAAPLIAEWIKQSVERPLIVGPDVESDQWVSAVAQQSGADYIILKKLRRGDRSVEIYGPNVDRWRAHTPVIVDDIVSTARTMIETVGHLVRAGMPAPICVGVHGILAGTASEDLLAAGAERIVTCNTVPHPSNLIDVSILLSSAVQRVTARITS